jgi:hypothetical protein
MLMISFMINAHSRFYVIRSRVMKPYVTIQDKIKEWRIWSPTNVGCANGIRLPHPLIKGWKRTMGEPLFTSFHPKKWCRTNIIDVQWTRILMTFFGNLNIRKIILECTWQHFGTQSSFWIKVKLDPMVRWRELDKINVHKVYNVHLSNGHRTSYLWFMTHYQTKEKWKKKCNAHL